MTGQATHTRTAASNWTVWADWNGCHHGWLAPLNAGDQYEIEIGQVCLDCGEQFWYPETWL